MNCTCNALDLFKGGCRCGFLEIGKVQKEIDGLVEIIKANGGVLTSSHGINFVCLGCVKPIAIDMSGCRPVQKP